MHGRMVHDISCLDLLDDSVWLPSCNNQTCLQALPNNTQQGGDGGAKLLWAEARRAGDQHLDVKRTTGFDTRDMADLTMEKENKSTRLTLGDSKIRK